MTTSAPLPKLYHLVLALLLWSVVQEPAPRLFGQDVKSEPSSRSVTRGAVKRGAVTKGAVIKGALYPQISADGKRIVFSYQGAIWRMDRQGESMVRLTSSPGFDIYPTFSPDGKWIAFIRTQNNIGGLLVLISAEDGKEQKLSRQIAVQGKLVFDKDGKRLLGRFNPGDGSDLSLRWLKIDEMQVGPGLIKSNEFVSFALSKDSERIYVAKSKDVRRVEQTGNNGPQNTVFEMRAQGGPLQPVFEFPARIYRMEPWADGKAICVVSDLGTSHNNLWTVPLDNPQLAKKMTFGIADEDFPSLSNDGCWLLYSDNRTGPTTLKMRNFAHAMNDGISTEELTARTRNFRSSVAQLTIKAIDEHDQKPVSALVTVEQKGGKAFAPFTAMYGIGRSSKMHFYMRGSATLTVPAGDYVATVFKGPEYRPAKTEFQVDSDEKVAKTITMTRWTDQRKRGWYSGEAHIHANYGYGFWYNSPRSMHLICSAEDLQVANLMVANSDGDGVFDREYFRGSPDPVSTDETILYWNEEFRSTIWGHMTLLNLKRLVEPVFTGFLNTTNPHDHITNVDIGLETHSQKGHVNYTHPSHNIKDPYLGAYSAKALPVDVALGTVDSIDVMGSNHRANMEIWYRLLNCGFKIPASAGTDCFSNRIPARPPGEDRAYVQVKGKFSYLGWIDGLRRGKSFVTNGPMLSFSVDEKSLGESVQLDAEGKVGVSGRAESLYEMTLMEVVYNGKVIHTAKPTTTLPAQSGVYSMTIDEQVLLPESGWLAIRAYGKSSPYSPISQFAHSSPVYVEIKNRPFDASKDAKYFVDWIDRLWEDVQKRDRILKHKHVEDQIMRARKEFMTKLLKQKVQKRRD